MTNLTDSYLKLCTEFYDLDKPQVQADAFNFYLHYIQLANGPILEPMCGTGRFLIPFFKAGYDISGFDASPFMLEALYKKCQQQDIKPNVWQQLLQSIEFHNKFGFIFIPDGSFCLITDIEQVKLSLQKIYHALLPGGKFVFEIETLQAIPRQLNAWQGKVCYRQDGSMIINNTLALPLDNEISTTICRYELIQEGSIIQTEIENFKLRLYAPKAFETLLKEIGFSHIKQFKPYNVMQLPEEKEEVIGYECIK